MAVSLKHAFSSGKADGVDATLVQPSNWNAEHTLQLATNRLLGRTSAGTGAVEEIAITGTGSAVLNNTPSITNPTVTNYSEAGVTTSGTSLTVDLASGTFWRFTISGGNATMSPIAGAGAGKSFILILTQDSSPRTMTWPVNVVWPGGTPPTLSTNPGKRDIYSFFYDPTTPSWLATTIGQNY